MVTGWQTAGDGPRQSNDQNLANDQNLGHVSLLKSIRGHASRGDSRTDHGPPTITSVSNHGILRLVQLRQKQQLATPGRRTLDPGAFYGGLITTLFPISRPFRRRIDLTAGRFRIGLMKPGLLQHYDRA